MTVAERTSTAEFDAALAYLPERLALAAAEAERGIRAAATEIRLRLDAPLTLTSGGTNIPLNGGGACDLRGAYRVTRGEIDGCVAALCEGSPHAQAENIRRGFIMASGGVRAGVCGASEYTADAPLGAVTAVNIRVPRFIEIADDPVTGLVRRDGLCGILVYSPPAMGKTTLLRFAAAALSRGGHGLAPRRVVLADERRELYMPRHMSGGLLDVFSGCPKHIAIETAVRTMNPELIICDEIGGEDETEAILGAATCGIPLIASAHAGSVTQLYAKPRLRLLLGEGIFDWLVGLSFDGRKMTWTVGRCGIAETRV